jgi:hypothetical protein
MGSKNVPSLKIVQPRSQGSQQIEGKLAFYPKLLRTLPKGCHVLSLSLTTTMHRLLCLFLFSTLTTTTAINFKQWKSCQPCLDGK